MSGIVNPDDKMTATTTVMEANGRVFLAGGHWSSPVYKKAPGNLAKAAAAEGVTGKSLSAAFFAREQQIAFYSFGFGTKPKKGIPLAWAAITQVGRRNDFRLPFMGIFNLGPVWWFIVIDVVGNVLPGCDRTGSREEILGVLADPDLAGMLNPFRENAFFLEDYQDAWQWLLNDLPRHAPVARPVNEKARQLAIGITALGVSIIVVGGGAAGWHWWQSRTLRIEQKKQEMLAQEERMSGAARLRAQAVARSALQVRLVNYWADYPRPWETSLSWPTFDVSCAQAWEELPENVDGWIQSQVECTAAMGKSVILTVTWTAGPLATVLHAPKGRMTTNGETIIQTMKPMAVSGETAAARAELWPSGIAARNWIGLRQEYAPEMNIFSGVPTAFTPPVPSFVPPDQVKGAHPPELWRSFPVTWSSTLPPWSGWPVPAHGFVPGTLIMNRSGGLWSWTLQGEQYAQR